MVRSIITQLLPWSRLAAEAVAAAAALEPPPDWRDSEEGVAWADALDALDVAVAERRGLDALNALHRAEALVSTVPPVEDRLTCAFCRLHHHHAEG